MIMRFRPANISLINRRHYLPLLLLPLPSTEKTTKHVTATKWGTKRDLQMKRLAEVRGIA
jgi:hypothetical protein